MGNNFTKVSSPTDLFNNAENHVFLIQHYLIRQKKVGTKEKKN